MNHDEAIVCNHDELCLKVSRQLDSILLVNELNLIFAVKRAAGACRLSKKRLGGLSPLFLMAKPSAIASKQENGQSQSSKSCGRCERQEPFSIVVPYHRVIGANGTLTGYTGGMNRKGGCWILNSQFWKRDESKRDLRDTLKAYGRCDKRAAEIRDSLTR